MWNCARSSISRLSIKPVQRLEYCVGLQPSLHVLRSLLDPLASNGRYCSSTASMGMQYQLPRLDNIENIEKYKRGGFHPIHLADTFKGGRYRILHKLGYGGFSTAWLARDEHLQRFFSLKVLTAEASDQQKELKMLRYLDQRAQGNPRRNSIVYILDNFTIEGPNGTHICYVSQIGGPSIAQLLDSPGQIAGSRRLHGPLARKLAGQLANAVFFMHSFGITHGGMMIAAVLQKQADH